MTPDDIYRAYDGLRPSDAAKERMLQAIRAEAAGPKRLARNGWPHPNGGPFGVR